MNDFKIFDILSQREAIKEQLNGKSKEEKLSWLGDRGKVSQHIISDIEHYIFESSTGMKAGFFFDAEDEIIFIGEHTTFK